MLREYIKDTPYGDLQKSLIGKFVNDFHDDDYCPEDLSNDENSSHSQMKAKFSIDNSIDDWSPIKHFKTIEELRDTGGNVSNRLDYLLNRFGKGNPENIGERQSGKTPKSPKYSSFKANNLGRGGANRGRGRSRFHD